MRGCDNPVSIIFVSDPDGGDMHFIACGRDAVSALFNLWVSALFNLKTSYFIRTLLIKKRISDVIVAWLVTSL